MIKICTLLLLVFVHFGCAQPELQSEPELSNASVRAAEQPVPSPNGFPPLSEKDLKRLDERFPKQMRDLLEKAQRIQVYETVLCTPGKRGHAYPEGKGRVPGLQSSPPSRRDRSGKKKAACRGNNIRDRVTSFRQCVF